MKIGITIALLFTILFTWAQGPDQDRMQREIEVAENILATLLEEPQDDRSPEARFFISRNQVEGSYLEGVGVLFTIQPDLLGRITGAGSVRFFFPGEDPQVIIQEETEKSETEETDKRSTSGLEERFRQVAGDFMADYAFLLRRLPDEEKVMIRLQSKPIGIFAGSAHGAVRRNAELAYSAVLPKADILAFQSNRISREQLADRIAFTFQQKGTAATEGIDRELELLSGIFGRLYRSDLSEDFHISSTPSYERIPGVGAVLNLSMMPDHLGFAPAIAGLRFSRGDAIGYYFRTEKSKEEPEKENEADKKADRAGKADEAYPAFEKLLLENIVEYGSIVKALADEEALIFQVSFPDCDECKEMPGKLEVTARRSTLQDYRQGRLALEQAAGQLSVTHKG